MKRRPRRSLPAALVAVILLAAGALVAVTAVQMLLNEPTWISYDQAARTLHGLLWTDTPVLAAGIVAAALGVLLLLCAVVPGARTVLPLAADDTAIDSGASRHSYRGTLRAAADVDGVDGVKLKVRGRSLTARVRTERTNTTGLAEAVEHSLAHRLDQIAPAVRPAVKIKLKAARSQS
ncbi:DUF6286 domain-containing protein [Amycolatopsis thermalba]|uniref:DUF6286 domain-containing protein n=1 Tax=Amycolatopsis thermalba TaxID=944492 RepID=UPI000E236712|nr:DUF6286 domain-containing protein [Amycolatopsis thermalba]